MAEVSLPGQLVMYKRKSQNRVITQDGCTYLNDISFFGFVSAPHSRITIKNGKS